MSSNEYNSSFLKPSFFSNFFWRLLRFVQSHVRPFVVGTGVPDHSKKLHCVTLKAVTNETERNISAQTIHAVCKILLTREF